MRPIPLCLCAGRRRGEPYFQVQNERHGGYHVIPTPTPQQAVNTPKHSASGQIDYEVPLNDYSRCVRTSTAHEDSGSFGSSTPNINGVPNPRSQPGVVFNGRVSLGDIQLHDAGANLTVAVWVRNLFNEQHLVARTYTVGTGYYGYFNDPRAPWVSRPPSSSDAHLREGHDRAPSRLISSSLAHGEACSPARMPRPYRQRGCGANIAETPTLVWSGSTDPVDIYEADHEGALRSGTHRCWPARTAPADYAVRTRPACGGVFALVDTRDHQRVRCRGAR